MPGKPLIYGQSITDGCIDWETTVPALNLLADAVAARRTRGGANSGSVRPSLSIASGACGSRPAALPAIALQNGLGCRVAAHRDIERAVQQPGPHRRFAPVVDRLDVETILLVEFIDRHVRG